MPRLPRQAVVIGCLLLLGGASGWLLAERSEHRLVDAGFWFEPVTYASSNLGEPVTEGEMKIIERIARAELTQAFAGLRIRFSSRSDATYRVRVVQQLRDPRFRTNYGIAGESRAVPGFGGQGTLGFYFLASSAEGYAPDGADRAAIIRAIGRGIGRAAVHELTHQLLPAVPIHDSSDTRSYEYGSAARPEQYYGDMRWDLAWPILQDRFGS